MNASEFPQLGFGRFIRDVQSAHQTDWIRTFNPTQQDPFSVRLTIRGGNYLLTSARCMRAEAIYRKAIVTIQNEVEARHRRLNPAGVSSIELEALMSGEGSSRLPRELVAYLGSCGLCTTDRDEGAYVFVGTNFLGPDDAGAADKRCTAKGGLQEGGWGNDICLIHLLS